MNFQEQQKTFFFVDAYILHIYPILFQTKRDTSESKYFGGKKESKKQKRKQKYCTDMYVRYRMRNSHRRVSRLIPKQKTRERKKESRIVDACLME